MNAKRKIWCVVGNGQDNWFSTKREAVAYASGNVWRIVNGTLVAGGSVWKLVNGTLELQN